MEILLVEDHLPTATSVQDILRPYHQVTHACSCQQAFDQVAQRSFDIFIVDLHLPDGSGLEFCRQSGDDLELAKVLVLSGRCDTHSKVTALRAGADDYLTKPFVAAELRARLEALQRRGNFLHRQVICCSELCLEVEDHRLKKGDKALRLTSLETRLLATLMEHHDRTLTRNQLLLALKKEDNTENSLQALIKNLRRKLRCLSKTKVVETVYGVGYRFSSRYAKS